MGKGPGIECTLHGPKCASAQHTSVAAEKASYLANHSVLAKEVYAQRLVLSVFFDLVCSKSGLA